MAELELQTRRDNGVDFVTLTGDFDADSAPRVQQVLAELCDKEQPVVFLEMAQLGYIDSAGLGVLVGALKQASARAGRIVLVSPSPFVSRILRVTALDKVFAVHADAAQARASVPTVPPS